MDLALVAAALSGLAALLLVVVVLQVRSLANAVRELASAPSAPRGRKEEPLHQVFARELKDIADQIGKFDIVFSDIQAQLDAVRQARLATPAPAPPQARPAPQPVSSPAPVPQRPMWEEEAAPAPSPRPAVDDKVVSTAAAAGARGPERAGPDLESLQPLIKEYRALIAEPRKNEINRWSDEAGGWACELQEDGTARPLAREAGGLLVLIAGNDDIGIIVPGGRLVVDFPTDFANTIAMRRVTRDAFELINDGTGVLRLTEAAVARRAGDRWQLVRAGKLAGLKSE
jgi:hypothetical protein